MDLSESSQSAPEVPCLLILCIAFFAFFTFFYFSILNFSVITAQTDLASRVIHVVQGLVNDKHWLGKGSHFLIARRFC